MAQAEDKKIFFKVVILCLLWYVTSTSNSIIGKTLLNEFPFPVTLTMVQLISISFYSGPVLKFMGIKPRKKADISWTYYKNMIIPLSIGKFIATLFAHFSLWKVAVSYGHTVKATMPLFTVVISRLFLGEKQILKVYCSLIPIVVGVAIATITEISFDLFGMSAALTSTCGFAVLTIFSKKVLTDTGIHPLRLLHLLGKLALAMFTPIWLFSDISHLITDHSWIERRDPVITSCLLFMDGFLNWIQNLIAFSLLHLVTPLTYAVANTSKRICVISISLLVLGNPVTVANSFGMFLAIMGVFGYNKSKYDANKAKEKAKSVPLSKVMSSTENVPHPADAEARSKNSTEILAQYFSNPLQMAPFSGQLYSGRYGKHGLPNGGILDNENSPLNSNYSANTSENLPSNV